MRCEEAAAALARDHAQDMAAALAAHTKALSQLHGAVAGKEAVCAASVCVGGGGQFISGRAMHWLACSRSLAPGHAEGASPDVFFVVLCCGYAVLCCAVLWLCRVVLWLCSCCVPWCSWRLRSPEPIRPWLLPMRTGHQSESSGQKARTIIEGWIPPPPFKITPRTRSHPLVSSLAFASHAALLMRSLFYMCGTLNGPRGPPPPLLSLIAQRPTIVTESCPHFAAASPSKRRLLRLQGVRQRKCRQHCEHSTFCSQALPPSPNPPSFDHSLSTMQRHAPFITLTRTRPGSSWLFLRGLRYPSTAACRWCALPGMHVLVQPPSPTGWLGLFTQRASLP